MVTSLFLKKTITRSSPVTRTARDRQIDSMFDVRPAETDSVSWDVDIEIPAPDESRGQVIVMHGGSGSGKTTIARELFGAENVLELTKEKTPWSWPADSRFPNGFAKGMSVRTITDALSSVGFSSPPAWRRPFHVLSNGQQFRVNLARALAERELVVIDEFGAFVDPQIRMVAAAAAAKAARRMNKRFVALVSQSDCVPYFEPDVLIEIKAPSGDGPQPVSAQLTRGLVRRPPIQLRVIRTDRSTWLRVRGHHYLSGDIHRAAACYAGLVDGKLAAFTAVLFFPHPSRPGWREHRTVCLPEFQGVGIGNAMSEFVASVYAATGKPYRSTTSHPAMIRHRMRSKNWKMTRKPGILGSHTDNGATGMTAKSSSDRLTAGFEFVGPPREMDARRFGLP
ncbi:hypothetical protein BH09PLA1_BH09PLA1_25830 [soil metagenome]